MGSVLGASFRFRVLADSWVEEPGKSADNPEGIPERTITEVRLFEFGPVVYPASPDATAGVRGLTDYFFERSLKQSGRSARARDSLIPILGEGAVDDTPPAPEPTEPHEHSAPTRNASRVRMDLARL
jgi:hypothetical protein